MIQFLFEGRLHSEQHIDPTLTVLRYLRERAGKCGTKEGCASGDCGACTVVVGEVVDERLRYRTLNACLTFLPALHGKQLISVESLKHQGALHPVQQAMVDCHASQCGFCTPGFVMSLFALSKQRRDRGPAREATLESLAGNLCRCTGYRPIVDAAEQACRLDYQDQFDASEPATVAQLNAIGARPEAGPPRELQHGEQRCLLPHSLEQLAEQYLTHPDARLLAGGTDLALEVTQQQRELPLMIHLGQVAALRRIEVGDSHIEIGAAAALSDCLPLLAAEYPDFGELLQRFASQQIRNQATLGGNIGNASPIGDSPPLLLALGAQLVLRQGERRRTLDLDDYFVDYKVTARQAGEFIERVRVPRAVAGQQFRAYKVSKRLDDDISAVCAAFNLRIDAGLVHGVRIAYGGMAATPKRALACEAVLLGAPWEHDTIERACQALAEDFAPLSDLRASKAYRLLVAQNLLRKCFFELQCPEWQTRVIDHA
ncbi:xanthine dehydrogenase small subunit [Phytopseudomonas dryadis]|uniref:Xanthine dehydrogenase small subunit n=1 Tax=Phytopseudomonas dryadis TaxID=2487520 RepID=A0A4Q9QX07_9GAMM|nr:MULTISPECIES: xanthine dehydrogenase small subunit [Pseudomonas]TBU88822.1 xanthine dehydrogenase small subunit [Pseudomonas dryadis]TBV00700.1 xanthine dehydrogenase small subunit [Pseudomonas dryadis]TBV13174.1 xanthine dehydrogenase small subunit [Pseudomonas sp. FRB 230]